MLSRITIISIASQVILIIGMIVLGIVVYQVKQDISLNKATNSLALNTNIKQPQPVIQNKKEDNKDIAANTNVLLQITEKLAKMEEQIKKLENSLANKTEAVTQVTPPPENKPPVPTEEQKLKADLRSRFNSEAKTSPWGATNATAIENAYTTSLTKNPFFAKQGGDFSTDCRETVCSLSWKPTASKALKLSNEERVTLLEQSKWEMLSLLQAAKDVGQFNVVIDSSSDSPSVELIISYEEASNNDFGSSNVVGSK